MLLDLYSLLANIVLCAQGLQPRSITSSGDYIYLCHNTPGKFKLSATFRLKIARHFASELNGLDLEV